MKARDIMTTPVVTVSVDMPVDEVARTLLDHRISGAPVVRADGELIGVVSEGDLMRRVEAGTDRHRPWWREFLADPTALANDYIKSHGLRAQNVMTRDVITVKEDTALSVIADLFQTERIKRVPVVRGNRVVGIVSRADLLRLVIRSAPRADKARPDDHDLRDAFLRSLEAEPWADRHSVNVVVQDGVLDIYGIVGTPEQRNATRVLAEALPGVRAVRDHLSVRALADFAD